MILRPIVRPVVGPVVVHPTAMQPRTLGQQIAALFASGEQGAWYDIAPQYCYQDTAGTTPAVVGQPVGLVLDRSKGLVLGPEESLAESFVKDSDGTVFVTLVNTVGREGKVFEVAFTVNSYTGVPIVQASGNNPATNVVIQSTGHFRAFVKANTTLIRLGGVTTSRLDVTGISVRELPGNHASQTTATSRPILRQNATTGAYYLEFDGADDGLVTNNIDFTATDKMTVWAGVRKLSDAATGMLVELSASSSSMARSFAAYAPLSSTSAERFGFRSRGSGAPQTVYSGSSGADVYAAPVSTVLTGVGDITAALVYLRLDGQQVGQVNGNQGTGNYGNHPLYLGRRGDTPLHFNGHIYGLIVRGAASNDSQIKIVERYLAQKTGVTLA